MTILVTGGAGYIGSHTVLALKAQGYDVVVIDDLSSGSIRLVPKDVTFIQANINDEKLLSNVFTKFSFEAIIHFAASSIVSESVQQPLKYYQNNVSNTITLLSYIAQMKTKPLVIFSSTASVYGIPENIPVKESDYLNPISPYGYSKLMAEQIIQDAANMYNFRYGILRYFNVAGADKSLRAGEVSPIPTHLIKIASEYAAGLRDEIQIFGDDYPTPDGTCVRDYIHVSDIADIHVCLMKYLATQALPSGIWNCGYGKGFSVKEVLSSLQKHVSKNLNVKVTDRRLGDPPVLIAEVSRLEHELQWRPKFNDIDEIVYSAVMWEKKLLEERNT